ncbi:MAG: hypothetical protein JRJ44_01550 [Deltaproteobacteria bacterium]|nr:hypothetical protein [Deltaproteobacteria bacterium]
MENEKISDPKIDFEEDNTNSIFFEETKMEEIVKLKKRINYVAFFTFILICASAALFYFNLTEVMLEVKDGGALKIENFSKEIDAKIATLTALNSDFKGDAAKKIEEITKEANSVKKDFNKIVNKLKKIEEIEKALKNKPDKEELKKVSEGFTNTLEDKITSADFKKILEEFRQERKTSIHASLSQSLTKNDLEERIGVFEKDIRIKLLRIAGDAENLIANAKEEIEKDVDKKMSALIRDFEISMQNYIRQNFQTQNNN